MSYSIDANVLLHASNSAGRYHQAARRFLDQQLGEPELLYLAWPTAMAYLRIATHPSIFESPLTPAEALANLTALLAHPRVRTIGETENFLAEYARRTTGWPVRGNLVPDAHLATILFQNGIRKLYTHDTDFRKFDFLDARDPYD
jgi:hypothetical protein